jgi:hypothetical protein
MCWRLGRTTTFTTQTDVIGAWRLDGVPLGEYTLRIASSAGVQVETPMQTVLTVGQRGVQQLPPAEVKVVNLALFLHSSSAKESNGITN